MKLTDLMTLDKWVALEKEIHEMSGLDVNAFGMDGVRITKYKQWVNDLCPAIKATDKGQSFICAVAHMNIAKIAENAKKPVAEECDAGLLKIIVPIMVDDTMIGSIGACGFMADDGEIDYFMINKTTEIDENKLESLSSEINTVSKEKTDTIIQFIIDKINRITRTA